MPSHRGHAESHVRIPLAGIYRRVNYSEIDNKDFVSRFTLTPKNAVNKQPTITGYPTAAFLLVGNTKNGLLEMYG
ncbi:hypothetical protein OUZ56_027471 [Daphnia magna]|uniref:Uncharacterized protein n=1 Tax=Daphnia magna TaxID=35525 RepID=A0ABQ9ZPV3_9CRUS|nr:hypothetical protein OUZ56_027471 [Daphnia magna]